MNHNRYKATFTGADAPKEYSEVTTWAFMGPFLLILFCGAIEGMLYYGDGGYAMDYPLQNISFILIVGSPFVVFFAKLIAQSFNAFGLFFGFLFGGFGVAFLLIALFWLLAEQFVAVLAGLAIYHLVTAGLFFHYHFAYENK